MARVAISVLCACACACSTYELPGSLGEQCELNSDCDAPLVCRLGYCRVECASARDCARGLDCVYDNMRRGACQLQEERHCAHDSDCPATLVCTMGECTNECNCTPDVVPCRDCPPGAACIERMPGERACLDRADDVCVYDSDCVATDVSFVCAPDERCRVECRPEAAVDDCRNGERCLPATFPEGDGGIVMGYLCTFVDAPAMDGGSVVADGGVSDGAAAD